MKSGNFYGQKNQGQEDQQAVYLLAPDFLVLTGFHYQRSSNLFTC
jgi:hypothetical protein